MVNKICLVVSVGLNAVLAVMFYMGMQVNRAFKLLLCNFRGFSL